MEIQFIKQVVFSDQNGKIVRKFEIGDRIEFTHKGDYYFTTSMGGIYFDEAEEVNK